jgi:hypothetical protein
MTDDTLFATYETAGGTASGRQRGQEADEAGSPQRWLRSDHARRYEGLWVLLGENGPRDSDLSPSALLDRNPSAGGVVVYVEPRVVQIDV